MMAANTTMSVVIFGMDGAVFTPLILHVGEVCLTVHLKVLAFYLVNRPYLFVCVSASPCVFTITLSVS